MKAIDALFELKAWRPEPIDDNPVSAPKEADVITLNNNNPGPANDSVNYIPEEAIRTSEMERSHELGKRRDLPKPDKYSESRVSETEPTVEEVKSSPADRSVMPG